MPEPLPTPDPMHHGLRGGFPESLGASTDELSLACAQLGIDEQFVVHSGNEQILHERILRINLRSAMSQVAEMAPG